METILCDQKKWLICTICTLLSLPLTHEPHGYVPSMPDSRTNEVMLYEAIKNRDIDGYYDNMIVCNVVVVVLWFRGVGWYSGEIIIFVKPYVALQVSCSQVVCCRGVETVAQ